MKLKYLPFLLLLAASSLTYGDEENKITESRIVQIENSLKEHSKRFDTITAHYDSGNDTDGRSQQTAMPSQNTTPLSTHGCLDKGFSFQGEFLYWRANMDLLEYVFQTNGTNLLTSTHGDFREPDFEYDPGVRVRAGYDFGRSNWDVNLVWTYHYSSVSDSSRPSNQILSQVATKFQTAQNALYNFVVSTTAKADWQVRLNALDLEFGYDYFYSERFSMRPHFGLKAAWIDMHYNVAYTDMVDGGSATSAIFSGSMRTKYDYWAVGPRMGFDSHLHVGWGFSLYGKVAGALIYGEYDSVTRFSLNREPTAPFLGITGPDQYPLRHKDYSRLRALLEMSIGVEWGYCFSNDYYLGLNIAWENQYWWNQFEMYFLTTDYHPRGDLTYSGLNAGLIFEF